MRRVRHAVVAMIAVAALAAGGTAASASDSGVVASASGASFVTIEDFFGLELIEVGPFTFNAEVHADGSVHGRYNYRSTEDGAPFHVRGSITCAVISGNRAWLGGIVEKSTPDSYEGQEMWFQVADHGEPGADDSPDITTLVGVSEVPGSAQDYCDRAPEPRFPWFIERGNIQVRS